MQSPSDAPERRSPTDQGLPPADEPPSPDGPPRRPPDGPPRRSPGRPPKRSSPEPASADLPMREPCGAAEISPTPHRRGTPYIPSYMDMTNGPEPCVVCEDSATGYHYRSMTCEGCKGFFRRTVQKGLKYHCKFNGDCLIDRNTRNQCQHCRFNKCIKLGMATDLVLNERQRVAKRKLIDENRERRKAEQAREKAQASAAAAVSRSAVAAITAAATSMLEQVPTTSAAAAAMVSYCPCMAAAAAAGASGLPAQRCCMLSERLTAEDIKVIETVLQAYDQNVTRLEGKDALKCSESVLSHLGDIMTPSIVKVIDFAKQVPGFILVNGEDQMLLLKSCCIEIMCLRAACRYNMAEPALVLNDGFKLFKSQLNPNSSVHLLLEPIFEFAQGISKLRLDKTEVALLAAILLMQSDRTGLHDMAIVEEHQDALLTAFKGYVAKSRPRQPVHWAKILMKVTDLRAISARHAERVMAVRLDNGEELPPFFLEMFDEANLVRAARQRLLNSPSTSESSTDDDDCGPTSPKQRRRSSRKQPSHAQGAPDSPQSPMTDEETNSANSCSPTIAPAAAPAATPAAAPAAASAAEKAPTMPPPQPQMQPTAFAQPIPAAAARCQPPKEQPAMQQPPVDAVVAASAFLLHQQQLTGQSPFLQQLRQQLSLTQPFQPPMQQPAFTQPLQSVPQHVSHQQPAFAQPLQSLPQHTSQQQQAPFAPTLPQLVPRATTSSGMDGQLQGGGGAGLPASSSSSSQPGQLQPQPVPYAAAQQMSLVQPPYSAPSLYSTYPVAATANGQQQQQQMYAMHHNVGQQQQQQHFQYSAAAAAAAQGQSMHPYYGQPFQQAPYGLMSYQQPYAVQHSLPPFSQLSYPPYGQQQQQPYGQQQQQLGFAAAPGLPQPGNQLPYPHAASYPSSTSAHRVALAANAGQPQALASAIAQPTRDLAAAAAAAASQQQLQPTSQAPSTVALAATTQALSRVSRQPTSCNGTAAQPTDGQAVQQLAAAAATSAPSLVTPAHAQLPMSTAASSTITQEQQQQQQPLVASMPSAGHYYQHQQQLMLPPYLGQSPLSASIGTPSSFGPSTHSSSYGGQLTHSSLSTPSLSSFGPPSPYWFTFPSLPATPGVPSNSGPSNDKMN